jgi:formate hydrogenlyase subunit 3/multisubunit Na+/H+ antiporter MnhD subunit
MFLFLNFHYLFEILLIIFLIFLLLQKTGFSVSFYNNKLKEVSLLTKTIQNLLVFFELFFLFTLLQFILLNKSFLINLNYFYFYLNSLLINFYKFIIIFFNFSFIKELDLILYTLKILSFKSLGVIYNFNLLIICFLISYLYFILGSVFFFVKLQFFNFKFTLFTLIKTLTINFNEYFTYLINLFNLPNFFQTPNLINFNFFSFSSEPFNLILFSFDNFSTYNKYLILVFIFLYYLIIYFYYRLPISLKLNNLRLKTLFLLKYEYPLLVGFLILGYFLVINTSNLFIVYLGIELQTLTILIISGQFRKFLSIVITSIKYFFLSIISSIFMLLGIAYIYNFTGSLNYNEFNLIVYYMQTKELSFLGFKVGILLLTLAILFKLGVFPFYIWVLDIFESFPRFITLLLLTLNKFNLYIFLIKFLFLISYYNFYILNLFLHLLTIVGLSSLFFGSFLALTQTNIHRFFAATSITHLGFLLLGLKVNLFLVNFSQTNSFIVIYSYFIIYMLHTFILFFILLW